MLLSCIYSLYLHRLLYQISNKPVELKYCYAIDSMFYYSLEYEYTHYIAIYGN